MIQTTPCTVIQVGVANSVRKCPGATCYSLFLFYLGFLALDRGHGRWIIAAAAAAAGHGGAALCEGAVGIAGRHCGGELPPADRCDQDEAAAGHREAVQGDRQLRRHDRQERGRAGAVEGIDALRHASDAQVHAANGDQRAAPDVSGRFRHGQAQLRGEAGLGIWSWSAGSARYRHTIRVPSTNDHCLSFSVILAILGELRDTWCRKYVVKIRLQQQRGLSRDKLLYKGPIHCAGTIIQQEGILGLWSGALPTVMRNGINQAAMFTAKNTFDSMLWKKHEGDGRTLQPWQSMASGFLAGCVGPVCTGPFDVVKTRLMAQSRKNPKYSGMFHAIATIRAEEGVLALWKGLLPRLMRIPPGQAIMWAVADQITGLYERKFVLPSPSSTSNGVI
ncbi:mitochondrial substrate carrier family protein P isoform X1 [Selaginella moellendorffii]|uniref:mitochondrial substrate carrier family protein P isoform X1 n=1 Tax=Selaginella moellendorffii TaxID=88036 RepID=UPI000D1CA2BA|nr:mitochondrial substrate carrier family protein P isoform X1 [Selaginella moellendorffii]XP_024524576.1 mitochondrial substrate carrier family protein P isoform X1 [Selaginella moellendorffii]|eukprot:XP_024524575.1 mitochondrial substrate carrier family protein P isoform X1 [Selaginella moellendorffii]